jgi:hypothetical protein
MTKAWMGSHHNLSKSGLPNISMTSCAALFVPVPPVRVTAMSTVTEKELTPICFAVAPASDAMRRSADMLFEAVTLVPAEKEEDNGAADNGEAGPELGKK